MLMLITTFKIFYSLVLDYVEVFVCKEQRHNPPNNADVWMVWTVSGRCCKCQTSFC